jgi:hypothetical protein
MYCAVFSLPRNESIYLVIKIILKHLGLWFFKSKPTPKARAPQLMNDSKCSNNNLQPLESSQAEDKQVLVRHEGT